MTEEGVIKFKLTWEMAPPPDNTDALVAARQKLYQNGLIGIGPDGIGYGNISIRAHTGFIITGSTTGGVPMITPHELTQVTAYNIADNTLTCRGPIQASSESLSHAAIYECSPAIQAVAHVHNNKMWTRSIDRLPTTPITTPYGTPEMAAAILHLYKTTNLSSTKTLVMAGHTDGLIAFGATPEECATLLLKLL